MIVPNNTLKEMPIIILLIPKAMPISKIISISLG